MRVETEEKRTLVVDDEQDGVASGRPRLVAMRYRMSDFQRELPPSTGGRADRHAVSRVRGQIACARALLDEVDRCASPGLEGAASEQLVEELARLGCACLELASALTGVIVVATSPQLAELEIEKCASSNVAAAL
jgi:hypothetical protein